MEEEEFLLAVTADGSLLIFSLDLGCLSLVSSLLPGELQMADNSGPISQVSAVLWSSVFLLAICSYAIEMHY